MAKQFGSLNANLRSFIERQHVFFAASATTDSRVNISPREIGAFRIVDDNTVVYLDRTGSGNETAAHLLADGRLTIMLCALSGPPLIIRLYGLGRSIGWKTEEFARLIKLYFNNSTPLGSRKFVELKIDLVQTSCGYGVPMFDYQGERTAIENWHNNKGIEGLNDYWAEKNMFSIDGLATGHELPEYPCGNRR